MGRRGGGLGAVAVVALAARAGGYKVHGCGGLRFLANYHKSGNSFTSALKSKLVGTHGDVVVNSLESVKDGGHLQETNFSALTALATHAGHATLACLRAPAFSIPDFRAACAPASASIRSDDARRGG